MNKKTLVLSILPVLITYILSSYFTYFSVKSKWYKEVKPSFTPPSYIFPIVWTFIYFSLVYIFYNTINMESKVRILLISLLLINLLLNIIWCYVFFYLQDAYNSRFVISLLLINIILLIYLFMRYKKDKIILVQLFLYLSWIMLATILNFKTKL
jgi:tryptophan-rich sensory protein